MDLIRYKYHKVNGEWVPFKKWVLTYEPYEYNTENVKIVKELIIENLSFDLLSSKWRQGNKTNPLFGHCYHATQALFYLLGEPEVDKMSGTDSMGNTHWWLQDGDIIYDVTAKQYEALGITAPYDVGKPTKWYGWKHRPHKRSMTLMQRVQPKSKLELITL